MKKYILIILVALFHVNSFSQNLKLMTYNIRLDVASDGENAWVNRKEILVSQLKFYAPDIFGVQEALHNQVNFINTKLANYSFVGEGRDGGNTGEYSALYFNKNKITLLKSGTFWLSETPNIVSKGWDSAFPRLCTYGLFKNNESGKKFWVFNTHLDHMGVIARKKGLELILKQMEILNTTNLPTILMGDFNLQPNSDAISFLKTKMKDSYETSIEIPFGPAETFNAFNYESNSTKRIDYIFVSNTEEIIVQKYAVLNNSYQLKFPSDHFPVFVQLTFEK
ncbi:Metal-dependent hydrolase, endonuclease/exonuclease/phosphatase family [Lutibacter agarilyticus]|uniref:Metal-dependent hydrolase, endonuclease/exonuclease/phosphatase family n=1 Tax=Lutibacter agarilyticus TaxID=1109740 RepID=A0A238WPC0_9FLAO|nr:endonuclease/exonuclease/phosphatase family protein [Lutibacter agarilyticus]SNR48317.1 Metal-dependent hydrolase, endonuclease/exonuclease/phosphatase family [Lutibacter agarilyticus]